MIGGPSADADTATRESEAECWSRFWKLGAGLQTSRLCERDKKVLEAPVAGGVIVIRRSLNPALSSAWAIIF